MSICLTLFCLLNVLRRVPTARYSLCTRKAHSKSDVHIIATMQDTAVRAIDPSEGRFLPLLWILSTRRKVAIVGKGIVLLKSEVG